MCGLTEGREVLLLKEGLLSFMLPHGPSPPVARSCLSVWRSPTTQCCKRSQRLLHIRNSAFTPTRQQ
jgi:hypothetical protein